jgi:hypothetical protein
VVAAAIRTIVSEFGCHPVYEESQTTNNIRKLEKFKIGTTAVIAFCCKFAQLVYSINFSFT